MKDNAPKKILKNGQKQKGLKTLPRKLFDLLSIKHNFTAKILSLVFAIVFWIYVMEKVNPEVTRVFYNVPVSYVERSSKNLIIVDSTPFFADVEISGRRNDVLSTRTDALPLFIDYGKLEEGENLAEIQCNTYMDNVVIQQITPSNLFIQTEKIISVPKHCEYRLEEPFSDDLSKSKIKLSPAEIVIRGPRSKVNTTKSLVAFINKEQMMESSDIDLVVRPLNANGQEVEGVVMTSDSVRASVNLIKTKNVPIICEYEDKTDDGFLLEEFKLSKDYVLISGEPEVVDSTYKIKTSDVIISGYESEEGVLDFVLPSCITVDNEEEYKYEATIEPVVSEKYGINSSEISVVNLDSGLTAEVKSSEVVVTLVSSEKVLGAVEEKDIALEVDADGLGKGMYALYVEAAVKGDNRIRCHTSSMVTVEIK